MLKTIIKLVSVLMLSITMAFQVSAETSMQGYETGTMFELPAMSEPAQVVVSNDNIGQTDEYIKAQTKTFDGSSGFDSPVIADYGAVACANHGSGIKPMVFKRQRTELVVQHVGNDPPDTNLVLGT